MHGAGRRATPVEQDAEVAGKQRVGDRPPVQPLAQGAEYGSVDLARLGRERGLGQAPDREVDVERRRRPAAVLDPVGEQPDKTDDDAARAQREKEGRGVQSPGVIAHEMGHAYFAKNVNSVGTCHLPCSEAGIKRWGVNEGLAKIVAHDVKGVSASAPTADKVDDILAGSNCKNKLGTATGAAGCAHDIGNLVFKTYKELLNDPAITTDVFDAYLEALDRLGGTITPAALHRQVRIVLLERIPPVVVTILPQPPDPDPFAFRDWLWVLWAWGIPVYIVD